MLTGDTGKDPAQREAGCLRAKDAASRRVAARFASGSAQRSAPVCRQHNFTDKTPSWRTQPAVAGHVDSGSPRPFRTSV